jgi:hypothetical protein
VVFQEQGHSGGGVHQAKHRLYTESLNELKVTLEKRGTCGVGRREKRINNKRK